MIWDTLAHSGASQIHTHMHGFLGKNNPLGQFRAYKEARQGYAVAYPGAHLTQDYINVHIAIGLGTRLGKNGERPNIIFFVRPNQLLKILSPSCLRK